MWSYKRDGRSWGIRIRTETTARHTKYGRMRGMVVGEGGRSSGVLLYNKYGVIICFKTWVKNVEILFIPVIMLCRWLNCKLPSNTVKKTLQALRYSILISVGQIWYYLSNTLFLSYFIWNHLTEEECLPSSLITLIVEAKLHSAVVWFRSKGMCPFVCSQTNA